MSEPKCLLVPEPKCPKPKCLNESQYAYCNNSSTEQALVNITEQIYKSIDKGKISLLVLLDLSKPFDSVNHDLLLNKLVQLNIDSMWFASYLHRTHSVKIDKNHVQSKVQFIWSTLGINTWSNPL